MAVLICSDRDGTINKDENYYLGKDACWKEQVEFLPGVVAGLTLLNSIHDAYFFITTAQSGVAISSMDFLHLTEERAFEVNNYIVGKLQRQGVHIDGSFLSPFVAHKYVRSKKSKYTFHSCYVVDDHEDSKPNIGLIKKSAEAAGKHLDAFEMIYALGDRCVDVEMGLKAGGKGIFIPSYKTKEKGDVEMVQKLQQKYKDDIYIAKDFLDAAEWIRKDIKKVRSEV